MSNSYRNDQFYFDMQDIKKKRTVQDYISNNFGKFWESFYNYLSYFHKQSNQSNLFIRQGPKEYLDNCFKSINTILENANIDNYKDNMKENMTKCFKSMLHPDNADFVKQAALNFFVIIYPRLKESKIDYTKDFEQYFFDFSFLDSNLKITSIDNETRIQITDQEKLNEQEIFNDKIDKFLKNLLSEEHIKIWWCFVQKYIINIFYYSIFNNKPKIQGISKLTDQCEKTEKILIDFLINITKKGFLQIIFSFENTPEYVVDILSYLSQESKISKSNSLDFINEFMNALINPNNNIIDILNNKYRHLLLELMSVLRNCLDFAFSSENKLIPNFTNKITNYFNIIFKLFNNDDELCSYISDFSKIKNEYCLLHFLTLLLCLFVNNRVTDKKIWGKIFNSKSSFNQNLILSCFANFTGYFTTYAFCPLLNLDITQISKSYSTVNLLQKFLNLTNSENVNLLWSNEFGNALNFEYQNMFIDLRQQLIHSLVLKNQDITSIKMEKLVPFLDSKNSNTTSIKTEENDPKKEALQLLRVMFSSILWEDKKYENDELTQFNCYLICASFITPLLKISNVISPDITFDRNFLIEEFLPYLMSCIKSSCSNLLIKLHALTTLGNIICWKTSITALDKHSLADWYITLHDLIINGGDSNTNDESKNDLKLKIKLSALTFACRSVYLGFEGSSILLETIADNFDLLKQVDENIEKFGSSTGLNSYLVDGGFEILAPSEVAALLVSLSNICEISNIFNFNCYKSEKNDQNNVESLRKIKDELKLKLIQNCIDTVDPSLRATTIVSLLSEEAEANRCNETNIEELLSILFQNFKDLTPEKVYAATTITLILPELEKVKKGSVASILDEAIQALEEKKNETKKECLLYARFTEFVVDLLIYSSFIINTEKHLKSFSRIVQSLNLDNSKNDEDIIDDNKDLEEIRKMKEQTKQRLQYAVLSLATHYLRFPPSTPSFSVNEDRKFSSEAAASFGSSKDCILRICDNEIASLLPVGQFTWNFKSVAPKPEKRVVSNDVSISEPAPNVSEYPTQIEFTNRFTNFVDDLYTNHFIEISEESNNENVQSDENSNNLDNFEVSHLHLYEPSDFESSFSPSLETNQLESTDLVHEHLPPHSAGPKAAAFMSSLSFFDSQMTNRLFPSVQSYNVEVSEFRHVIHVGFITLSTTKNDNHYRDFISGLGLLNESQTSIICADSRHQLVFHINEDSNQYSNIFICWDGLETTEEWVKTFDEKQRIRIEIKPKHNGLFNVSVLVNKGCYKPEFRCLSNALITKNNLPNFVISQIIVNVHILDFENNEIELTQLQNGINIRDKRLKNFASYLLLLNCETTLLTEANSNNFEEDDKEK